MGVYYVSRYVEKFIFVVNVVTDIVKIYYYRICVKNFDLDVRCVSEVRDDIIFKYVDKLVVNYKNIIKKFLLLFMFKD